MGILIIISCSKKVYEVDHKYRTYEEINGDQLI